jgi:hypothetical protein
MISTGAVASGGITPASGERKTQRRKSAPVTTDASPVRPPSLIPDADSMNVVFDDALAAPPAAAASESTRRTRFMPGSFPSSSSRPASSPSATAVPIVSKKSDSMTANTDTIAVQNPSAEKKSNEKFPRRLKSGVPVTESGTWAIPGPTAFQITLCPQIPLMIAAMIVVPMMPIRRPPRTLRMTSVEQRARPMVNVNIRREVKFVVIPSGGTAVSARTTMPALTSPMIVRKSPIPIAIARFRSIGIAFRIAFRNPVRTSSVITSPSTTITPIACGQVRPFAATSVNATNAFSPSPEAIAKG